MHRRHRIGAELVKRMELQEQLARLVSQPLTPGVELTLRERASIAERVRSGKIRQSVWPGNGGPRLVTQ